MIKFTGKVQNQLNQHLIISTERKKKLIMEIISKHRH